MARSVDDWVQEQVDLTVYGRVRPGSDSKMETGGHDPGGHDPGGGASPKKSKKTEAATEQRKMPPRRVKCSKKSDGRELHSRPTKRKREEPAQVAAQQDHKSCVDDAEVARARKKEDKTGAGGEPAGSFRCPGVYRPKVLDCPLPVWSFEFELLEKLGNTVVLCDSRGPLIRKVWFLKNEWPMYKDNFFTMQYAKEQKPTPSDLSGAGTVSGYVDLDSSPPIQNQDDLNTVLGLFAHMASSMTYEYACAAGWTSETSAHKAHDKVVKEAVKKDSLLGPLFSAGDFIRAFRKKMSNSAGKAALQAILHLAGVIAYGRESAYDKMFACYTGSSDPSECFPVKEACDEFLQVDEVNVPENDESETFESLSSVSDVSGGSKKKSKKENAQRVYADAVLLSGCEPNWPHFAFVGEVKKTPRGFLSESVKQLQREMLGTLMFQSLAFGIIMNDMVAIVYSMKQDFHQKKIFVSERAYDFSFAGGFVFDQFKEMFLDIVKSLLYIKGNIREIDRGF